MISLDDTNSAAIAAEFLRLRKQAGSPVMGMVFTLIIVVNEEFAPAAMEAARSASHEHPSRVLGVILGDRRGRSRVAAELGIGDGWTGETALIRLSGEVADHPEAVVLPLLLPDSPVVAWWPADHPEDPAADPIGRLAQRRITDAAYVSRGKIKAMQAQCAAYSRGNSDLAWTRITPWRALLAAALDQHPLKVLRASVSAERISPSADLLAAWMTDRLRVPVERKVSEGPGITAVTMETKDGPIGFSRPDGTLATFSSPGRPDRPVALKRRDLPGLLAEELRHLDEDDVYADTAHALVKQLAAGPAPKKASTRTSGKAGAKKTTGPKRSGG